jgi:uncharacterized protein YabE (DUF348 family)
LVAELLPQLLHLGSALASRLSNVFSHLVASSSATGTGQQVKKAHLQNPPKKGLYVNLLQAASVTVNVDTKANNHRFTAPFSVNTIAANNG